MGYSCPAGGARSSSGSGGRLRLAWPTSRSDLTIGSDLRLATKGQRTSGGKAGDHQRHSRKSRGRGRCPGRHPQPGHLDGLLPGRHRRLRSQPLRMHRSGDGASSIERSGQPRSSGAVRSGGLQQRCRTSDLLDPQLNWRRPAKPPENAARWKFLCELPRQHHEADFSFVHGSARNPLMEYVFPEDVHNPGKLQRIFSVIRRYCFQGHTHVPGDVHRKWSVSDAPPKSGSNSKLPDEKAMINVGSVGQPRDGNPQASYVIQEGRKITFRRVRLSAGDNRSRRSMRFAELDNFLGDRLREGR